MAIGIALTTVLAACETESPTATGPTRQARTDPPSPELVKVAFIQDLSAEAALDRTLPALQAVELAFSYAALEDDTMVAVELVTFAVTGDPAEAEDAAAQIAADPAYVAAFAAPYLGGQHALARALDDVPLLSLSARGRVAGREPGTWLRFVAPLRDQALALAELVRSLPASRRGVCLALATGQTGLDRAVRRALEDEIDVTDAVHATEVFGSGCGVVVWTGDGLGGARLALELDGTRISIVGGSRLRDPDFLEDAGRSAEGALSICSCADVSTSLDLAARRFIQDYQSEYGSPPGQFAVEAWDAAHILLRALDDAGRSREGLADRLAGLGPFRGLGGRYDFDRGELVEAASRIHRYRVQGGRWLIVGLAEA